MKKWIALIAAAFLAAGSYAADIENWQFNDVNGTQLNAVTNSGTAGTAWNFGGPQTQNGNLNIGDTTFWTYQVLAGQVFRSAEFTNALTSGKYIFEFNIADWDLAGTDGLGTTGNGIKFNVGSTSNGSAQLEFEVAQAPGDDVRVRSQNSNDINLTGTDAQSQLGALDLTNTAPVKVQLLADLDTGEWSTQVDYGTGFVPLVTNGLGMADIDRIQLVIDGGSFGWEWDGLNGSPTEFVQIDSVSLSEDLPITDPWIKLEYFDCDDVAGAQFNGFVNSGTIGSSWNFGGPANIETDGAGSLVISNYAGQTFRKLPGAGYTTPFTSGVYRLELDLASWTMPSTTNTSADFGQFAWEARPTLNSGSTVGFKFNINPSNTNEVRVQMYRDSTAAGNQNGFVNATFPRTNLTAQSFAITFEYGTGTNAGVVEYFQNGISIGGGSDFNNTQIGALQFSTSSGWDATNVLSIDAFGLSQQNEAAPAPVLAVDFSSSEIASGIQIEYFDVPLDLVTPAADAPAHTGQPIYAGLELDPVSGKITGVGDGGTYTNGAAISFGSNGGAKLQWNGPFPGSPGDDAGRYEEDDVATGIFLVKKEDFLGGLDTNTVTMAATNDTLTATVELNTGIDHNTYPGVDRLKSGQFRWVIQDDGVYYISDEVANLTSDSAAVVTAEALDVNWFNYDPVSSITDVSGTAASPTLQDINAIGFWLSATVNTNDGNRTYPFMGCSSFEAQAVEGVFVAGPFSIVNIQLISGNTQAQLTLDGLAVGQDYKIQDTVNLTAGFSDVAGSQFTATVDTGETVVVPADTATQPERFFKATVAP